MIRLAPLCLIVALGGCTITTQQVSDAIAKVEAGLAIAEHEARELADLTCGQYLPAANQAAMQLAAAFPNPGPKTARYLGDMNRAIAAGARICATYQSASGGSLITLGKQAYRAYKDWRLANARAVAAGGA